jgi:bis(5'-nucleosidyl)-tetraphosphatase
MPAGHMRYERHASAGIIVFYRSADGLQFLLLLSRLTKRPLWEFPKGGVDAGESPLDAALRELREETGLTAGDVTLVPSFERTEDYRFTTGKGSDRTIIRKQVTYFLAEARHQEVSISTDEVSEFEWVDQAIAEKRIRYPERRRMLKEAISVLEGGGDRLAVE